MSDDDFLDMDALFNAMSVSQPVRLLKDIEEADGDAEMSNDYAMVPYIAPSVRVPEPASKILLIKDKPENDAVEVVSQSIVPVAKPKGVTKAKAKEKVERVSVKARDKAPMPVKARNSEDTNDASVLCRETVREICKLMKRRENAKNALQRLNGEVERKGIELSQLSDSAVVDEGKLDDAKQRLAKCKVDIAKKEVIVVDCNSRLRVLREMQRFYESVL